MYYLKISWNKLQIPQKIQKGYHVAGKLEDNPVFPNPDPTVAELRAVVKALEDAHQEALDGAKSKRVSMYHRESELDEAIVRIAAYVQNASRGDREAILSSGFEVRNGSSPSQPVTVPSGLKVSQRPFEGEVQLTWTRVPNARIYTIERSEDNGASWTSCGTATKAKLAIPGLTVGSKPLFRVAGIGALGQSEWSDAVQGKVS